MTARLMFVGFDSASATLIERWADAGVLPNFQFLREQGAVYRLSTPLETLPGAIWPDIPQGRPARIHGQFYHPGQAFPDEGVIRPLRDEDLHPDNYLWADCHAAGLRCAVIDVPFQPFLANFNGIQVREWSVHDVLLGTEATPEGLLEELEGRFGPVPYQEMTCDAVVAGRGRDELLTVLMERAGRKSDMLVHLLEREAWDLFYCVYGETHCAGHQFWPAPERGRVRNIGSIAPDSHEWEALRQVYRKTDEGLGRLIDAAGGDAMIVAVASHGIGPYRGGPQLLPEVMRRLGLSDGADTMTKRMFRNVIRSIGKLPVPVKQVIHRAQRWRGLRQFETFVGMKEQKLMSPACRAMALPNNRCGAIRFNISGREAQGVVAPDEADALAAFIETELMALTDPKTGRPIIRRVDRADDLFGPQRSPLIPDLIVVFRTDLGAIEVCRSPSVGTVRQSLRRPGYWRFGDHMPESRAWIMAPGYPKGAPAGRGEVLDLAPTVLSLLGVPIPADMTGVPLNPTISDRSAEPTD